MAADSAAIFVGIQRDALPLKINQSPQL